jgi:hypothetical protein
LPSAEGRTRAATDTVGCGLPPDAATVRSIT